MADTHDDNEETEVSRKRTYETDKDSNEKPKRPRDSRRPNGKQPLLKLLIPDYAAGSIIGKGGNNLFDLQSRYGATIWLSHHNDLYPGTNERIALLTGEVSQIIDFNDYIIDQIQQNSKDTSGRRPRDESRGQQVKIILPNSTAGIIIGRGGATIKALKEETKANIGIVSRDESKVPGERLLIIRGNTEQRLEAARQIISKIASDRDNMANTTLKYTDDGHGHDKRDHFDGGRDGRRDGGRDHFDGGRDMHQHPPSIGLDNMLRNLQQNNQQNNPLLSALSQNALSQNVLSQNALSQNALSQNAMSTLGLSGSRNLGGLANLGGVGQQIAELTQQRSSTIIKDIKTTVQIQMEIPTLLIGPILGVNGNTINEFMKFSGAKIQFSSNFTPGTSERVLTIHGDLNQSQIAYYLINQKITESKNEIVNSFQRR